MPPTRSELFKSIKEDYPSVLDDMINMVLDLYETNPDFIEQICKEEKKKTKGRIPKVKTQLTFEEFEKLNSQMENRGSP